MLAAQRSSNCSVFMRTTCSKPSRVVRVNAESQGGPTGINVKGKYRPTSKGGWETMSQALKENNIKMIPAHELLFAQERGVPVIDIRPSEDFDKGHIPDAINVPFYQPIQGWTPWQVARRIGYASFGVFNGTEVNPNFAEEMKAAIDAEKGAILYCSLGGSLDPTETSPAGLQSRSLIAAYQVLQLGYTNVSVLKGGFLEWSNTGRDVNIMVDDN